MTKRLFAAALCLLTMCEVQAQTITQTPPAVMHLPFDRVGVMPSWEDDPNTVLSWNAEEWNLLRFPDDLTHAVWVKEGTLALTTTDAPDGSQSAYREALPSENDRLRQQVVGAVPAGSQRTLSAWIRGTAGATAELTIKRTDTTTYEAATKLFTLTGAWQFVSVSHTFVNAHNSLTIYVVARSAGNTATSVDVWHPQLVVGLAPKPYKPMTRAPNVVATTDITTWTRVQTPNPMTVTANTADVMAPDGTQTATKVEFPAITGAFLTENYAILAGTFNNNASGTEHRGSVWLRTLTGTATIYVWFPTPLTTRTCSVTAAWTECRVTGLPTSTSFRIGIDMRQTGHANQPAQTVYMANARVVRTALDGDTFVMNGAVPRALTSPLYPNGFGAGRRFVGPFSDTGYFSRSAITTTTAWTICVAYSPDQHVATRGIVGDGVYAAGGATLFTNADGSVYFAPYSATGGAAGSFATTNTGTLGALNVACYGRNGSTAYVKLNGGRTTDATPPIVFPGSEFYVGKYPGNPFPGRIYEVWATHTGWDEARVTAIQAAALANGGQGGTRLFPDDENTVLHVVGNEWNGGAAWGPLTKWGATAVGYSDAWVPPINGNLQRTGYGPFSSANYLSLGAGTDVLDFPGDFSACVAFTSKGRPGTYDTLLSNNGNGNGYDLYYASDGPLYVKWSSGGANAWSPGGEPIAGVNIACWGRNGGNAVLKTNLTATDVRATAFGTNTANAALLGFGVVAGHTAEIHALWASTTPASDANFTQIARRFFGMTGTKGEPVTVTRATTRTCDAGGRIWLVPANIACVAPNGVSIEPAATNSLTQSENFDAWAKTTSTVTVNTDVAPDGTLTADTITVNVEGGSRVTQQIISAPATTITYSVYIKPKTTNYTRLTLYNNTTSTILAVVNYTMTGSGSATVVSGTPTYTITPASNGFWRLSMTISSGLAVGNAFTAYLYPGNDPSQVVGDSVAAWGAQVESSFVATSYIPTTTAALGRHVDAVSVANVIKRDRWCVTGTWTANRSTFLRNGYYYGLWEVGDVNAANSFGVFVNSNTGLILRQSDATNTVRQTVDNGTYSSPQYRVASCSESTFLTLRRDGVNSGAITTGTGVLPSSYGATMTLGGGPSLTDFNGWLRDFKVYKTPNPARAK